ncbi:hypothetical protein KP509_22G070700 [Ceratopteris richardii]|nr:hypothetical protein KP509_22G070700 [Ceratopteris richardii]
MYFLFTAALSLTPLAPFSAPSVILPLAFVVGVSIIKEAIEDWRRFLQDKNVNNRKVKVHAGNGEFLDVEWQNVRVGDVVQVQKDEFFPADLLMLSSSYPDGVCYVETMNLDGETNLKLKKTLEATLELDGDDEFKGFTGTIRCEDPNPNLYSFIGNLEYDGSVLPIGPQQILLRDSKLRNTQYIYGVVIFSGHETKVMQNAMDPPSKRSRIERKMDSIICFLFIILVILSLVGGIAFGIRTKVDMPSWWYLRPDDTSNYYNPDKASLSAFYQLITGFILYGYLIPISLYITLEVVKLMQARLINQDILMYNEETDIPAHARTSNLNEELGQVDTILSDKTGTLTCNQMDFVKSSIGGVSYGVGITEVERATANRMKKHNKELNDMALNSADQAADGEGIEMIERPHVKGFNFSDSRLMDGKWALEEKAEVIQMFMRILAVCQTVIPEENDEGRISYEAESPDEGAFVVAAREFGFEFFKRTQTSVYIRESDSLGRKIEREYKILNLLEFNSTRKRMSVVVRDQDGRIYLFCKGADSVIFERLSKVGKEFEEATKLHLANYGDAGLRTLALAYREVNEADYEKWNDLFMKAKTTIASDRDSMLDQTSDMIERELILVGATAVEDKLQKGVPECIDKLALAGIKIWVLTGDKVETAINIGFACSLLRQDMKQIIVSLDLPAIKSAEELHDKSTVMKVSKEAVKKQLISGQQQVAVDGGIDTVFALIIDGKSLVYALEEDMKELLLQLATKCAAVLCCRVSPKQKAMVTRLVKEGTGKTTLAIGDGANDVGMIQEADIGIGISGVEGMQAVMASDFSIGQFRFLERLLVVHGHWCYKRIATMICYFFYKNIVFGFTLFYYQAYTTYSGQTLYNDWFLSLFNTLFSSLPVAAYGMFEQDVPARVCLEFPSIYQQGVQNMFFKWDRILAWMGNGLIGSVLCFFMVLGVFGQGAYRHDGQVSELQVLGATMYTTVVWVVNVQLAIATSYFTFIQHLFIWGSVALWYIFIIVFGFMSPSVSTTAYRVFTEALAPSPRFWIAVLLVTVASMAPYFTFIVFQRRLAPKDHHILQELMYLNKHATDTEMWFMERKKAVEKAAFGFTARVDARVREIRKRMHGNAYNHQNIGNGGV